MEDIFQEIDEAYKKAEENSFKVNAILVPVQRAYELHQKYIHADLYIRKDGKKVLNNCVVIYASVEKIEVAYIL